MERAAEAKECLDTPAAIKSTHTNLRNQRRWFGGLLWFLWLFAAFITVTHGDLLKNKTDPFMGSVFRMPQTILHASKV
jgi:hypothetical protein